MPTKIYEEELGKNPENREPKTLAKYFVDLTKKNPDLVTRIIAQFVKKEIEIIQDGKMSANTLPNHVKPIKALLEANGVAIPWKSIYKIYPPAKPAADDRAYTKDELKRMIETSPEITDKIIVQMSSAGGFRLEAWDYFAWKDVKFFRNKDGSFKGAALLVYCGQPESYWTFLTPECCNTLDHYRENWKSQIGRYPKDDEPLLKTVKFPVIRRLNAFGVKKQLLNIVTKIGLRQPLPPGKRRHEVQLAHGFRKYFNTMMRRAKVSYLDKEDMMGHSVGLEKHYERY
ncbi:MAG: site-specific integrase, partial [Patescibacteria group bacterium]|nr:site-specific integrase [Patescibacteria group bacterium]